MRRRSPYAARTAPSKATRAARQMSGPVPSPSINGMTGASGTCSRPLTIVIVLGMAVNLRPDHGASNRVADGLACLLSDAFAAYHDSFRDITARAQGHFERRDWGRAQSDATSRLALYRVRVEQAVSDTRARLGRETAADAALWAAAKARYAARTCDRPDAEIAQTFFNSVARRVRGTVGSDPSTEFSGASLITANCEA